MSDELNKHTSKPRAEHMTRAELVQEFRTLQKWYNDMKTAVDELEEKHAELQQAYDEAVNLNLTMTQRLKNQEALLLNEITSSNEGKQMLQQRIQLYETKMHEMKKKLEKEIQLKLE